jgi:Acyl-CoA dehydrogenase, C-terminal domain
MRSRTMAGGREEIAEISSPTSRWDGVVVAASGRDGGRVKAPAPVVVVHPFGKLASSIGAGRLRVEGVVLTEPAAGSGYLVAVDSGPRSFAVQADDVAPPTPVAGFDPASTLRQVSFDIAIDGTRVCDGAEIANAAARRALACELIGYGQAMLDLAVEQVGQRTQFGRPNGANQTPRHRLADAHVQLAATHELVRSALVGDRPWDAIVAKSYAGYAVETTSRACLQVCGAIGLISGHPLGRYVKRFRTLDALYGGWQRTMHSVGEQLLASRAVPRGVGV